MKGGCYQPLSVEVENIETCSREIFDIEYGKASEESALTLDDKTLFALYIKDKF